MEQEREFQIIIHAYGSRRGSVSLPFVCLFIRFISKKTDQLKSPNMTYKMLHHGSGKTIYFGVKRSQIQGQSQKHSCECRFVLVVTVIKNEWKQKTRLPQSQR